MTPKEKAQYLFDNFYNHCFNPDTYRDVNEDNAKQCALIAVDEIIKQESTYDLSISDINYWQQVKQEINNL